MKISKTIKIIIELFFYIIIILFFECGGTFRYQVTDIKPIKGKQKSEIEILLKNGSELQLKKFEIFTEKIVGYDESGKRQEVSIYDIKKIFIIEESSTGRKIINTVLITGIISYLGFIILIAIFGVPGGGLQ
ncbi:MAG: hypothetical protein R6V04_07275 [bacterium]